MGRSATISQVPRLMRTTRSWGGFIHIEALNGSADFGGRPPFRALCGTWERANWERTEEPPTCPICLVTARRRLKGLQTVLEKP